MTDFCWYAAAAAAFLAIVVVVARFIMRMPPYDFN